MFRSREPSAPLPFISIAIAVSPGEQETSIRLSVARAERQRRTAGFFSVALDLSGEGENPMELLKELCETPGVSGREERLRAVVRRELTPLVNEIRVDALGNLVAVKRGSGAGKLMIAAHMDEIGFLVNH